MLVAINAKMTIALVKTRVIVRMITIATAVMDNVHPCLLERVETIAVVPGIVIFPKVERLVVVSIVKWMRIAQVKLRVHAA